MQPTPALTASPIPVPEVASDEPVAVIPIASVAPLDGPPDGERINAYALAPMRGGPSLDMRERVLRKPLSAVAAAFAIGFVLGRLLR